MDCIKSLAAGQGNGRATTAPGQSEFPATEGPTICGGKLPLRPGAGRVRRGIWKSPQDSISVRPPWLVLHLGGRGWIDQGRL